MNPIERLKLVAELTTLRKTAPEAKGLEKLKQASRLLEVRALLGANDPGAQNEDPVEENTVNTGKTPVAPPAPEVPAQGDARVDTSHFFAAEKPKGVSRQKLNDRAVEILRRVGDDSNAQLSEEEKAALALFSGYGGGLIAPDGKKGSAFEYYTPKGIAEGIWGALEGLGFSGGKVLDPSAGTGIFGATAPLNCAIDAVELSQYSGRVNQLVNGGPGYTCTISNFEKVAANSPDEAYDAVVTNVPFGEKIDRGTAYVDDPRYQDEPLENYFILRSLEKLRPNGMAAFIVPTCVVSGKGGKPESLRHSASLMAEFVGAYRLPTGTFSNADTDTVTDVIFFRKYSREVLEKIAELGEQNAAVLSEANVMWAPFLDGKYFDSAEGKPYVLGEFVAKDPTKFRDVDKVLSNASINDLREILRTRRLPKSRINWDLLEATETEPIVYEDGDTITQAGQTLVMRDGVWVALPKDNTAVELSARLEQVADPYKAFENNVDFAAASKALADADAMGLSAQVPRWLRSAMTEVSRLSDKDKAKIWTKGVLGLAVRQVIEERSNDSGVNFEAEYQALTAAMKNLNLTQADTRKVKGEMSVGMKTARLHYTKKTGYSDFWTGNVRAEVTKTAAVQQALETPEAKFAAYRYESKSQWMPIESARELLGEGVNPIASDDYCISGDGKTFTTASDYYVGNYKEFLDRIDAEIAAATDETVKNKLLRQKQAAESHITRPDFSSMTFTLSSPMVTPEEKLDFLKQFVSPNAQMEIDDGTGKPYPTVRIPNAKTTEEKLLNRFGQYLKNGTVTLGGAELDISDEQAFERLRGIIRRANEQFNTWSRANQAIMGRIQARANDPRHLRFNAAENADVGHIPGMNPELKLHPYQAEYVSKMGREFGGINGFGVGLGKTFTALAAVQHVQAIGVKKKTLFVVPNSVLSNWRKEASRAYETIDDCLFVGLRFDRKGKPSVKAANYDEDLARIRENRHSKIFMSMEAFERLKLKAETIEAYSAYMSRVDESFAESESKKKDEQTKAKKQSVLDILGNKTGAAPYLEDLGIDSIVMDEAHFYKNSSNVSSFKGAQYLSLSTASKRGLDAQAKAWYVRGLSKLNDGVLLLTATPITNSPLEIYSMMSLAVGHERVNDAAGGVTGADAFMEAFCDKVNQESYNVDGTVKAKDVFIGLMNVDALRNVIQNIATIKSAKDVGATVRIPDRDDQETNVTLTEEQKSKLDLYKAAYGWAVDDSRDVPENMRRGSQEAFDAVQQKFGESEDLIGHPFNLINKMTMVIADPELDERATFYSFAEFDRELAEKVIDQFNAKKVKEKRNVAAGPWTDKDAVHPRTVKGDDGESSTIYETFVRAKSIPGNRIVVDTMEPKTQSVFEDLAEKAGLDLDVRSSAKISAMLENFKKEMAHPRGMIDDGVKSPIVKQIIFCDILALHNKIKRLLVKRAGVPAGKIAVVTGQINSSVEEIQAVQDAFNAQGEDNRYQVVIANKKAEVGINLQKGTQAIHHLTIGWTPDSLEQRNGRGARQGNKTEKVTIYYYNADGTFDAVKKDMVSHKGEWISNVTSTNGGNKVKIEGGMSNEDMEILIESSGDKDAVQRAREQKAENDRRARIRETRARQLTNLDTYQKQAKFLQDKDEVAKEAAERIAVLWDSMQAQAKAKKNLETAQAAGKKTERQERRLKGITERVNQLTDLINRCVTIENSFGEPQTLANVFDHLSGGRITSEDIRNRLHWWYTIKVKEDSEIYADWASAVAQAKGMMEEAKKSFTDAANEEGGLPAHLMQSVLDEDAAVVGDSIVEKGAFIRDDKGQLAVVKSIPMNGAYNYVTLTKEEDGFVSGTAYKAPAKIIYRGDPEWEDCLREAAEIEDRLSARSPEAFMGFSQNVPEVENFRSSPKLDWYKRTHIRLPAPYFPDVITPGQAENSPIFAKLFEEQKEIVRQFSPNEASFAVDAGTEMGERGWFDKPQRLAALWEYAQANGVKLTEKEGGVFGLNDLLLTAVHSISEDELDDVVRRELVTDPRMVRITVGAYVRAKIQANLELPSSMTDEDLYDWLGVYQKQAVQYAVDMLTPADTDDDWSNEPETDDDMLEITGETYPWRASIKEAATSVGERAKWSRSREAWLITRRAWKALQSANPEAAKALYANRA